MSGKTRPDGYTYNTPPPEPIKKQPSMGFMIALSIILGVTIAAGTILSTVGNAFFVTRTEYQNHEKNDVEVTTTVRQTLKQIDSTLAAQSASFKDLATSVEGIRIDMARRR
jgi:replicative superfamily II helicase